MASVSESKKACTVNPLKMSQPLGACFAFMGMDNCMPMMHGSQGCTSFGLVLLVRHFKEAIPLQTTAMNEVSTILGGLENIEQAVLNIKKRANPSFIAIASTGLTETKGDDVDGYLKLIHRKHGETLAGTRIVYVSTPDYVGAFEDGWAKAVTCVVDAFAEPCEARDPQQINLLPGCHLTAADIDELREIIASFGLKAIVLPDISGSLDGHIPENFTPTTLGGTTLAEMQRMGASVATLAIGSHMSAAAMALEERSGVPYRVFERLTGLGAVDELMGYLSELSGQPVAAKYRRQRGQLQDAMLDAHFWIGSRKFAIGAEPDLLAALTWTAYEMGGEVLAAVTTTPSPVLAGLPCAEVLIGDLEDLETRAKASGCEILLTHSHGRQAAERLAIPLLRTGLPMFDRLGASHVLMVGYRGTRELITHWANSLLEAEHQAKPEDWPLNAESLAAARGMSPPASSCGSGGCGCAASPSHEQSETHLSQELQP
ncbi:nitrogenase iron-molybdenum cofactor biosynthesis protein NifN [Uliginosibacterium aquaticum]|uniref:Nitrogenase iron-molybdenum cofactor biosynthesis protein NifN n=1 Tax=Uliginosibacterium aquaticum TaxID=2731212 RepID=A0ABX2ILI6_9RHOO|nr:nitrogenase iron-molybdenum cofactor biosynthesis protein NifN [Uliginosibacterium aquaticum]NSL54895.1 nitrogenase iron-molybdenum cofactor biosynthesis protein NifN [Uliginosibacterium aquaticum]